MIVGDGNPENVFCHTYTSRRTGSIGETDPRSTHPLMNLTIEENCWVYDALMKLCNNKIAENTSKVSINSIKPVSTTVRPRWLRTFTARLLALCIRCKSNRLRCTSLQHHQHLGLVKGDLGHFANKGTRDVIRHMK